jgi:DNA polymerase-3 subunit beta
MKFTVRKQDLQEELGLSQGVVEAKATIPILSHLLLRADRDGLELLSTDLEIGLRTRCAADVTAPGAATIPAKKLHDVVRALDCDVISFEGENNDWVKLEGGSFKSRVVGLPDADFPSQPEFPADAPAVRLPLAVFQEMLARVIFAVTTENTRFSINGALLKVGEGALTLVATDGHRLAHVTRPVDLPDLPEPIEVLVPRKALAELMRLKPADENDELELAASGNHVFFRGRGRLLYSRILEGSFPNYEKVIPAENEVRVLVGREALARVISRVAILTNDTAKMVTLALGEGRLTISTQNPSTGEAREELEVAHQGEEVRIGLNYEYLLQFLQVVGSESVEIRLKDSSTQALLGPAGEGGDEPVHPYQYVVMPMRLA